jgi:hypothetical protein
MSITTHPALARCSRRVALAASVAALGLWATPAGAAGPPVDRFDGIYATCDGLGEIFAVSLPANDRAPMVPTFSLDGGQVLVPISAEYTVTITPTGGVPDTQSFSVSRRAPANATIDTCVAHGVLVTAEGTVELHLKATLAVRP